MLIGSDLILRGSALICALGLAGGIGCKDVTESSETELEVPTGSGDVITGPDAANLPADVATPDDDAALRTDAADSQDPLPDAFTDPDTLNGLAEVCIKAQLCLGSWGDVPGCVQELVAASAMPDPYYFLSDDNGLFTLVMHHHRGCIVAARGCEAVRECLGGGVGPPECDQDAPWSCAGDNLVGCPQLVNHQLAYPCVASGRICHDDAGGGGASCIAGSCSADGERCEGDVWHGCASGVESVVYCAFFGLACTLNAPGPIPCEAKGEVCDALGVNECVGNVLTGCDGHRFEVDCGDQGSVCGPLFESGPLGCDMPTYETACQDDVAIVPTHQGPVEVDCTAIGFSGCGGHRGCTE